MKMSEKKLYTQIIQLFSIGFLSIAFACSVLAYDDDDDGGDKTKFVGHYKGFLDLSVLGNPRLEEISIALHKGGTASLVVDEDGIEMESTALGTWKRSGHKEVKIGVLQIRNGQRLCASIAPPAGRDDDVCTFLLGIRATIDKHGNMTGFVKARLKEFDDEVTIPTLIPLVDVKRTKLSDFPIP